MRAGGSTNSLKSAGNINLLFIFLLRDAFTFNSARILTEVATKKICKLAYSCKIKLNQLLSLFSELAHAFHPFLSFSAHFLLKSWLDHIACLLWINRAEYSKENSFSGTWLARSLAYTSWLFDYPWNDSIVLKTPSSVNEGTFCINNSFTANAYEWLWV